ncbi:MAG: hypothetical protein Kow001_22550 [Acidobacteriota bacterium]
MPGLIPIPIKARIRVIRVICAIRVIRVIRVIRAIRVSQPQRLLTFPEQGLLY